MTDILSTDIAAVNATEKQMTLDKIASTDLLKQTVALYNALPKPDPTVSAKFTATVLQYDKVTIGNNTLRDQLATLTADIAAAATAAPATGGPIPTSASGQAAFPPLGMLMDANKVVWTFGSPRAGGGKDFIINRNGIGYPVSGMLMVMKDGVIWINDEANDWWTLDPNQKPVTSISGPWGALPQDLRSWNTKDGATIVASAVATGRYGSSAFIVDMNAALWSFGAADGQDFVILRNGIPFAEPGFTTKPYSGVMIRLKNGVAYVQSQAGSWVYPPI